MSRPGNDDTGRISVRMHAAMVAADQAAAYEPERFLDTLARRLADRVHPPEPTFLGFGWAAWSKMLLGWALGAFIFVVTWYNTVNRDINDRPTRAELVERMTEHGAATTRTIDAMRAEISGIETEQKLQRQQIESIGEAVRDIRGDVKALRQRR